MFDGYFPVCLAERNGLHAMWMASTPQWMRDAAQAIEARRAATVEQGAAEDESAVPERNAP